MITKTKDYNKGPRVVRKDYLLWKIQNMPTISFAHSSVEIILDLKDWLKTPWVDIEYNS